VREGKGIREKCVCRRENKVNALHKTVIINMKGVVNEKQS